MAGAPGSCASSCLLLHSNKKNDSEIYLRRLESQLLTMTKAIGKLHWDLLEKPKTKTKKINPKKKLKGLLTRPQLHQFWRSLHILAVIMHPILSWPRLLHFTSRWKPPFLGFAAARSLENQSKEIPSKAFDNGKNEKSPKARFWKW